MTALLYASVLAPGTFMLNPFSKCDLERPTDRPLGFNFMQPDMSSKVVQQQQTKARTKPLLRLLSQERTCLAAIFKPEAGGRIIQVMTLMGKDTCQ